MRAFVGTARMSGAVVYTRQWGSLSCIADGFIATVSTLIQHLLLLRPASRLPRKTLSEHFILPLQFFSTFSE